MTAPIGSAPRHTADEQLRLLTNLAMAVHIQRVEPPALEAPIRDLVASLKGLGLPPERVVIQLKDALAAGGIEARWPDDEASAIVWRAVTWCVEGVLQPR